MALGYYKDGAWVGVADESQALPSGGAADEVLVKQTATDYDAGWALRAAPWAMRSGIFYGPTGQVIGSNPTDQLTFAPAYFAVKTSIDGLRVDVTTAGAAGAVLRLGLYESDSGGNPGALIVDAGTVDATTTGFKIVTITPVTVYGLIWVAAVEQVASSSYRRCGAFDMPYGGTVATAAMSFRFQPVQNGVSGVLPDPAAPTTINDNPTSVLVRIA